MLVAWRNTARSRRVVSTAVLGVGLLVLLGLARPASSTESKQFAAPSSSQPAATAVPTARQASVLAPAPAADSATVAAIRQGAQRTSFVAQPPIAAQPAPERMGRWEMATLLNTVEPVAPRIVEPEPDPAPVAPKPQPQAPANPEAAPETKPEPKSEPKSETADQPAATQQASVVQPTSAAPSRLERVEAIADRLPVDWRATGTKFRVGCPPDRATCHWGLYLAGPKTIWIGPDAFANNERLFYVVAHEVAHAWQYANDPYARLNDMKEWRRVDAAGLEAAADCLAKSWGASTTYYWNCPADAQRHMERIFTSTQ